MNIKSIARKDKRTKDLAKRINPGEIAIINHKDIDEVAAFSLAEAKIRAVINLDDSISGRYPNQGPTILSEYNIPVFECKQSELFDMVEEGETVEIRDEDILYKDKVVARCEYMSPEVIKAKLDVGYKNIENELDDFIDNTLSYAKKEKGLVLGHIAIPDVKTKFKDRHVLVVVRGKGYKKDLLAIKHYIEERNPVLIGVDGGGDALMNLGYTPDMIVGDMDSVSDKCLRAAGEIVVHGYTDGRAPGMERVKELGLEGTVFPSYGTSEDIAMLLAYEKGASLIVAVGTHSSMIDFLEKGRNGMASTFLVRLKIGDRLIDARGVSRLYKAKFRNIYLLAIVLAALVPMIMIILLFPPVRDLLQLMEIKLRLMLGF